MEKYEPEKTRYVGTFHAVIKTPNSIVIMNSIFKFRDEGSYHLRGEQFKYSF